MNAKQIKNENQEVQISKVEFTETTRGKEMNLWARIKASLKSSDISLDEWERLEMKRPPNSQFQKYWRSH